MTTSELGYLSWPEMKERVKSVRLAIIPTGSTEQHGPNMTFLTDTAIAAALAQRVCERLYPRAIMVPPLPFGISGHHLSFAGSLALSPRTFEQILLDISKSLSLHGITKVIVLNGHGGNQSAVNSASCMAKDFEVEIANVMHFSLIRPETLKNLKAEKWGHACEVEVSLAMHLCPEVVKEDALTPGDMRPYHYCNADPSRRDSKISVAYKFEEITANGALGDARLASPEWGAQMAHDIVEGCVSFAESFMKPLPKEEFSGEGRTR